MKQQAKNVGKTGLSILLLISLLFPLPTAALTLSKVEGFWGNVVGDSHIKFLYDLPIGYGNGLEDQVRWGEGAYGGPQSGLGFTGTASGTSFDIEDVFEIGQLRHFNNPIYANTAAALTELTISLSFSDPAGLAGTFDFTFAINETPNTPGPPLSDDIITFPASLPTQTFDISGRAYTLELLGFGNSPGTFTSYFRSPEGTTNRTLLWGRITSPSPEPPIPPPEPTVPEPGTIFLLSAGLIGIIGLKKMICKS